MDFLKRLYAKIGEWNYYLEEEGKPTSIISWLVDGIMLATAALVISYLWFVYKTKIPWLSVIFALVVAVIISIGHFKLRAKQLERKRQAKLNSAAATYRKKELLNLTPEQFKWRLAKALLHSGKFEDIKIGKRFLKATYKGRQALIGFYHAPYSQKVPPFEVYKFLKVLKHCGYTTGFYFTSSSFSDTCRAILQDHDDVELHLIDGDGLLKIMEKSGVFNDQDAINLYVKSEIEKSRLRRKQARKNLLTPAKARTYILYGLLFLVSSFIFHTYFIYYLILSVSFVLLGILVYTANPKAKEAKPRDEVLND